MCPHHPPGPGSRPHLAHPGPAPGVMSLAMFDAVIRDLHALGTRRVDLVGRGEPLLNGDVVEMVRLAARRGLAVGMTTNGSRLTPELHPGLVDAGLRRLRVSLNAGRAETYPLVHRNQTPDDWARVVDHVRAFCVARAGTTHPVVTLSFTVVRANAGEFVEMVEVAGRCGVDGVHFQPVIPNDPGDELPPTGPQVRALLEAIPRARRRAAELELSSNLGDFAAAMREPPLREPAPCYAGEYFTAVLADGHVMPCCHTDEPMGKLLPWQVGFADIWQSSAYRRFRVAASRLPEQSPAIGTADCDRCYFRPHNASIHRLLHPMSSVALTSRIVSWRQVLEMSRFDGD